MKTIPLLAILFTSSFTAFASSTYLRSQTFADGAPSNWIQLSGTQGYGYSSAVPVFTGGPAEAGGSVPRGSSPSYYADGYLNGAMGRNTAFSASGRLAITTISKSPTFNGILNIGHFNADGTDTVNVIKGMAGIMIRENSDTSVRCSAIITFSDGTSKQGADLILTDLPSPLARNWDYKWTPDGGANGRGRLEVSVDGEGGGLSYVDLDASTDNLDFSLGSFGMFSPQLTNPDAARHIDAFIGQLRYSALLGDGPKVTISGGKKRTLRTTSLQLFGKASIPSANRIESVRYRIIAGGKPGRFRALTGTTNWNGRFRVPKGNSRVQVVAVGDNGLTAKDAVKIRRIR